MNYIKSVNQAVQLATSIDHVCRNQISPLRYSSVQLAMTACGLTRIMDPLQHVRSIG
jgi:hypothetical protein